MKTAHSNKMIIPDIINQRILEKPITFKELSALNLELDDEIVCEFEEGYTSENLSYTDHYVFRVTRYRLETESEFNDRMVSQRKLSNELKQKRYERYLELKKEFES